jgi:hypothetical protein
MFDRDTSETSDISDTNDTTDTNLGSSHGMRNELTRRKLLAEEEKKASNGKEMCHFPRRRSLYV